MKNKLLLGTIIVASCVSCTNKSKDALSEDRTYVDAVFKVSDQSNMDHYELEISPDAKNYQLGLKVPATTNSDDTFSPKVDVTEIFKTSDVVYVRLKMVDKNGTSEYYKQECWVNRPK